MASKLYVGGLSYSTTSESLREYFAIGTVQSATVITDRMSGDSRGFGFVEMSTEAEAQAAIKQAERPGVRGPEADGERGEGARVGWWGAVRAASGGPAKDWPLVGRGGSSVAEGQTGA